MRYHTTKAILAALLCLGSTGLVPSVAYGQPSEAERTRAIELWKDAILKFNVGDYRGALSAFTAADKLVHLTTTGNGRAKALAALGKLVEARDVALEVMRLPVSPSADNIIIKAQNKSAELAKELSVRIPRITVRVQGVSPGTALEVAVDDATTSITSLSLEQEVNPGVHVITVSAPGYRKQQTTVEVAERMTKQIDVPLDAVERPNPLTPEAPLTHKNDRAPAWAWASGGVGLVALGVGAAFGVALVNTKQVIDRDCATVNPSGKNGCQSNQEAIDLTNRWYRDLGLAIGIGGTGVLALGASLIGLTMAPRIDRHSTQTSRITFQPLLSSKGSGLFIGGAF